MGQRVGARKDNAVSKETAKFGPRTISVFLLAGAMLLLVFGGAVSAHKVVVGTE
jgi:hypothetical protein